MDAERIISESHKLMQAIKNETTLRSIQIRCEEVEKQGEEPPIQVTNDFLHSQAGSDKDVKLKKIMATAIMIAKQNNCLPADMPCTDPVYVAKFADETLSIVKTGYQIATGTLDPVEAVDELIDSAAARTVTVAEYAFDSGLINKALTLGTVALLNYFGVPNAHVYSQYISKVISKVEKPIKKKIVQGITFLQNQAKTLVHQVASSIKEYVKNKITSLA